MNQQLPSYFAEVLEVHSGDDLVLLVSLGVDNLFKRVRARLQGVDTPDAYKASAETEAGKVRDRVKSLVKGKKCLITVHNLNTNKSGWVVTLHLGPDSGCETLNNHLRKDGYVYTS